MPTFDPTKPAANSLVSSAELRDQLNALNDTLTALSSTVSSLNSQVAYINNNIANLQTLLVTYSGTVTAADLNQVLATVNAIVGQLQA